jgi:hypothetical protein
MRGEIKFLVLVIIIVGIGWIAALFGHKLFSYAFLAFIVNLAVLGTGFVSLRRNKTLKPFGRLLWLLVMLFFSIFGFVVYWYFYEAESLNKKYM